MNNQIPYIDNFYFGPNPNINQNQPNIYTSIERINNRLNRLERQVKILENRVNRLASNNPTFLNNMDDDNSNMYML